MAKQESMMEFGKTVGITGGTAVAYAVGSNEVLRRTGLSYSVRATIGGSVGVLGGGGVAYAGAPRVGAGLAIGGLFSAFTNTVNAINLARYRGASAETRPALPTAAGAAATQTPPGAAPTAGLGAGNQRATGTMGAQPTRMPVSSHTTAMNASRRAT